MKSSLINEYVGMLSDLAIWEEIKITVDDDYIQDKNIASEHSAIFS